MKRAGFLLLDGLTKTIALLPFWLLYRLADITFVLLYYCVRYRRKLVMRNISDSFPEQTESEHKRIARRFYRNLADYFFETVKLGHISDRAIMKRMEFEGLDVVERQLANKRPVITYFSHCGNWEWATSVRLWSTHFENVVLGQVYRPLKNKWADRYMLRLRNRFNTESFPKATVFRELLRLKHAGRLSVVGFMSDQKPSHGDRVHILQFLNHPTAVITGTEIAARRLGAAAVYWDISKIKRGHYRITTHLISGNVADTPEYFATDRYISMLEQTIRREPSIWLWSHNRWKHKVEMPDEHKDDSPDS